MESFEQMMVAFYSSVKKSPVRINVVSYYYLHHPLLYQGNAIELLPLSLLLSVLLL